MKDFKSLMGNILYNLSEYVLKFPDAKCVFYL